MPIPWEKVILHGPQVLDAARGLYGKWQTRAKAETIDPNAELHVQVRGMASQLKALEEGEETQSRIIEQLAEQNQALSIGIAELKQQVTAADATSKNWEKRESSVTTQLKDFSAQLEKMERASETNARKISLALYAAFGALLLAAIAVVILFTR